MKALAKCLAWMFAVCVVAGMSARDAQAVNEVGDPNSSVVDVFQDNRVIDVDPGDQFWLTVPVGSGLAGMEVHREGDRGWTWLKAGEFLLVQYDQPGEYTIRFRTARARVLAPFTLRVFAPPAEDVADHYKKRPRGGDSLLPAAAPATSFSLGSVYAGLYDGGATNKFPLRIFSSSGGACTVTKYGGGWSNTYVLAANSETSDVVDVPAGQMWTLVKSVGGTHTLSTNSPSRLKVVDLILTNGPSYAPVGQSVTNAIWFLLTNDVAVLQVMPGPSWVTNNPVASASLFEWTTNGVPYSPSTGMTNALAVPTGTNTVAVSCHSPSSSPTNQQTYIEGSLLELYADYNRDDVISFDGTDSTTATRVFRFWTNDGRDGWISEGDWNGYVTNSVAIPVQDALDPAVGPPNHQDGRIVCARELENLFRVAVRLKGACLVEAVASNEVMVGMAWRPMASNDDVSGWALGDGSPLVNVYAMAPKHGEAWPTGGREYLDDFATSNDQATNLTVTIENFPPLTVGYGVAMGSVGKGAPLVLNNFAEYPQTIPFGSLHRPNADHPNLYMLVEGAARGKGRLGVTLGGDANDLGATNLYGAVHLDLRNIKELYERWTVGDGNGGNPANDAAISTARLPAGVNGLSYESDLGLSDPDAPEGGKYILYVHGYNMRPWEKDAFAETMVKRLYWSGYKGKVGAFQWPCTFGAIGKLLYDESEFTSWKTAPPLRAKLTSLLTQASGTYLLAHSQGNVAVGEALRMSYQAQADEQLPIVPLLECYVASQAAIPVHCYDPDKPLPQDFFDTWRTVGEGWFGIDLSIRPSGPDTPNIYPNWMRLQAVTRRVNFYNPNDWALARWVWETDQALKPNSTVGPNVPYRFAGNTEATPVEDSFVAGPLELPIPLHLGTPSNLQNRHEIMSFAAESRCRALGTTANTANFQSELNLSTAWGGVDFNGRDFSDHCWHSAQFRFSYAEQKAYWKQLLGGKGFQIQNQNQP